MWQRFTERARRVILFAQEEASKMDSGFVGSEHILLGILREPEGVAAQVLLKMGVGLSQVRTEIEAVSEALTPATTEPKLTPEAKRVLEIAADEARRMRLNYIGSEHILLALLRETGNGAKVLSKLGVNLEETRPQIVAYLGSSDDTSASKVPQEKAVSLSDDALALLRIVAERDARIQVLERELAGWRALAQTVKMVIQETERDWPLKGNSKSTGNETEDDPDFPDVQTVIQSAGTALVITGAGSGDFRALDASQEVTTSPLFASLMVGAPKLLISVAGGDDLTIGEVEQIVRFISQAANIEEANLRGGLVFKPELLDSISVTVVATGFDQPPESLVTANVV